MRPLVEDKKDNGSGLIKILELIKLVSALVTPFIVILLVYIRLDEEQRSIARWETPAFERRVEGIVQGDLSDRDLATKEDIRRLERQIENLSDQIRPITADLIRRGIIE